MYVCVECSGVPENAHEDRAKSQLFAIRIASLSLLFFTLKIHMIGPKISS